MSQAEFGRLIGVSQVQVSRFESAGERIIRTRYETLQKIVCALKADASSRKR